MKNDRLDKLRMLTARHDAAFDDIESLWRKADRECKVFLEDGIAINGPVYALLGKDAKKMVGQSIRNAFDETVMHLPRYLPSSLSEHVLSFWSELLSQSDDPRIFWDKGWRSRLSNIQLLLHGHLERVTRREPVQSPAQAKHKGERKKRAAGPLVPIAEVAKQLGIRGDNLIRSLERAEYPVRGTKRKFSASAAHIAQCLSLKKKRMFLAWIEENVPHK